MWPGPIEANMLLLERHRNKWSLCRRQSSFFFPRASNLTLNGNKVCQCGSVVLPLQKQLTIINQFNCLMNCWQLICQSRLDAAEILHKENIVQIGLWMLAAVTVLQWLREEGAVCLSNVCCADTEPLRKAVWTLVPEVCKSNLISSVSSLFHCHPKGLNLSVIDSLFIQCWKKKDYNFSQILCNLMFQDLLHAAFLT